MASVQFYGSQAVLDAAANRKCPAWAIFIGTAMFMKYEGTDMNESLSMLEQAVDSLMQSEAVYKIKFFEAEGKAPIKINEKTVCNGGSFNFKTIEPDVREQRMIGYAGQQVNKQLEDRVKLLEQQLKDTETVDEEPATIGGVVMELIRKPTDLAMLVNIFKGMAGKEMIPMEGIGNVTRPEQMTEEQRVLRAQAAISDLEAADPMLVEHLEKLAKMSKEKPDQLKSMLGMLDIQ